MVLNKNENIDNEKEKSDLIVLEAPKSGSEISSPLIVTGKARGPWYFEASFPIKLIDGNGKEIALIPAQAQSDWMTTEFVPFKTILTFSTPTTKNGKLILKKDNPSGLPENDDSLTIPIIFKKYTQDKSTKELKVFFNNQNAGDECEKVSYVFRDVPSTVAVGRAAIEELLKGPSAEEIKSGFSTSINSGVKINSLTIENEIAKIDFSQELDKNVAGSCRVGAIRSQITETLSQFPTVKSVIISVNGRIADVLQP